MCLREKKVQGESNRDRAKEKLWVCLLALTLDISHFWIVIDNQRIQSFFCKSFPPQYHLPYALKMLGCFNPILGQTQSLGYIFKLHFEPNV